MMHWFLYVMILTSDHAYGDYKARIPAPLMVEECTRLMGEINRKTFQADEFKKGHGVLAAYCLKEQG